MKRQLALPEPARVKHQNKGPVMSTYHIDYHNLPETYSTGSVDHPIHEVSVRTIVNPPPCETCIQVKGHLGAYLYDDLVDLVCSFITEDCELRYVIGRRKAYIRLQYPGVMRVLHAPHPFHTPCIGVSGRSQLQDQPILTHNPFPGHLKYEMVFCTHTLSFADLKTLVHPVCCCDYESVAIYRRHYRLYHRMQTLDPWFQVRGQKEHSRLMHANEHNPRQGGIVRLVPATDLLPCRISLYAFDQDHP